MWADDGESSDHPAIRRRRRGSGNFCRPRRHRRRPLGKARRPTRERNATVLGRAGRAAPSLAGRRIGQGRRRDGGALPPTAGPRCPRTRVRRARASAICRAAPRRRGRVGRRMASDVAGARQRRCDAAAWPTLMRPARSPPASHRVPLFRSAEAPQSTAGGHGPTGR